MAAFCEQGAHQLVDTLSVSHMGGTKHVACLCKVCGICVIPWQKVDWWNPRTIAEVLHGQEPCHPGGQRVIAEHTSVPV